MAYLDHQVKDAAWLKLIKEAFKTCHKEMPKFYPEIQKRAKFTKEICDIRYDVLTDCVDSEIFIVSLNFKHYFISFSYNIYFKECPEKSWTEKPGCKEGKKFVSECKMNFDAMEEFAENQH